MNIKNINKKLLNKLTTIGSTLTFLAMQSNYCLATGGIGTQEVAAATDNIKRVIISIAMPLRRCTYLCKCCNRSN